jgi:hypothetical protein
MAEEDRKDQEIDDSTTWATISGVDLPSAIAIQFTFEDRGFV